MTVEFLSLRTICGALRPVGLGVVRKKVNRRMWA